MGGSPGELSEELVTQEKRKKGWRMNCDVGEATEGLENELTQVKRRKGWRMSCDVGEVTERLENEQSSVFLLASSYSPFIIKLSIV